MKIRKGSVGGRVISNFLVISDGEVCGEWKRGKGKGALETYYSGQFCNISVLNCSNLAERRYCSLYILTSLFPDLMTKHVVKGQVLHGSG